MASARAEAANDSVSSHLDASHAPYVQGTVSLRMSQVFDISVGFVGKGADGKEYSNLTGTNVHASLTNTIVTCTTCAPQLTTIIVNSEKGVRFQHVKLAPGEYLFYAQLGPGCAPKAAWQQMAVKAGDQLTIDLEIDPAKMGSLIVTLPDEETGDETARDLSLVPIPMTLKCSRLFESVYFNAARVKKGQKTVVVNQVPAGKYRVIRGKSMAVAEVTGGKETAVTLVHTESNEH